MDSIVELDAVRKVYDSALAPALDGVTFEIAAGESLAVMGPSGSGKSTLLNLVAGLDRATSGKVRVAGEDLGRMNETRRARMRRHSVGLIFQFFNLLDNLTALENVAVAAELGGCPRAEAVRHAKDLLERLSLEEHLQSFPARMSGGQRQRVAVARALVNNPPLLLADEPTGALDTHSGEQVLDLLRDLNRAGRTLILITHDVALARACASRQIQLNDGRVAADSIPTRVAMR